MKTVKRPGGTGEQCLARALFKVFLFVFMFVSYNVDFLGMLRCLPHYGQPLTDNFPSMVLTFILIKRLAR